CLDILYRNIKTCRYNIRGEGFEKVKKQSIAQLKELFQMDSLTEEDINILRTDERKGVQALLKTYDKRREQLAAEREAFQKMQLFDHSYKQVATDLLAGIDEAGRGPL